MYCVSRDPVRTRMWMENNHVREPVTVIYKTHKELWNDLLLRPFLHGEHRDYYVVFEDSILLGDEFERNLKIVLNSLPSDWDIVMLITHDSSETDQTTFEFSYGGAINDHLMVCNNFDHKSYIISKQGLIKLAKMTIHQVVKSGRCFSVRDVDMVRHFNLYDSRHPHVVSWVLQQMHLDEEDYSMLTEPMMMFGSFPINPLLIVVMLSLFTLSGLGIYGYALFMIIIFYDLLCNRNAFVWWALFHLIYILF